ncbi:glycoside hydrolase family 3 N-terminal domain-containing protein [Kordiimonas sp.]|uniref:glycoside hydrolase family 3 protein n=1 Tax=Kordiimonas sp. TaxID=1970157 RepID=UPI003A8F1AC7
MIEARKKCLYFIAIATASALVGCSDTDNQDAKGHSQPTDQSTHVTWPRSTLADLRNDALEAKIDALLARMTVEEKVGQVIQADSASVTPEDVKNYNLGSVLSGGNSAPGPLPYATADEWVEAADQYYQASIDASDGGVAIPIIWGIDAVHGHNNVVGGTVFPHNIALGAAHNAELIRKISAVTARELRVTGHDWTFAPTLAVPQDDRWGRTYEGFSETPEITRQYAPAIVEGLQGELASAQFMGPEKVISSAKHFVADGGTRDGQDQGDAAVSEEVLRDIHGVAYLDAINAGVQAVMASFSSWNGKKIHGDQHLLTEVLKNQIGFDGFVVGDWNAHGQIEGCTNENCPQAINAGLDMYMAPDSWKGLYENTLQQVKDGVIKQDRLDDAVRRILRVKMRAGLFSSVKPSARPLAGDESILSSGEHKAVAREAVRQSLVLLKNNSGVLPIAPGQHVLVFGESTDSISDASGGWTLTWQGGGLPNTAFPKGESILSGLEAAIHEAGGTVEYSTDGSFAQKPDVAIAVYGEKPYAEFQGDVSTLLYANPPVLDALKSLKQSGVPTVSVFLSGRPMWVNPLINASDAFVAAWWPGTEGGGIADVLIATSDGEPAHDFSGKLSFSWPKRADQGPLNVGQDNYDPLFPYGYGLTYADDDTLPDLSEEAGATNKQLNKYSYFEHGRAQAPWRVSTSGSGAHISAVDYTAQEDAFTVLFEGEMASSVSIENETPVDLFREMNGAMELTFAYRLDAELPAPVTLSLGCANNPACQGAVDITKALEATSTGEWSTMRISLSCFAQAGADIRAVNQPFKLESTSGTTIAIAAVKVVEDSDGQDNCPQ